MHVDPLNRITTASRVPALESNTKVPVILILEVDLVGVTECVHICVPVLTVGGYC